MHKFIAIFNETTEIVTLSGLFQWDFGQKLYIKGLSLPQTLEIHFSNRNSKEAVVMVATTEGDTTTVDIPNILLEQNRDITAYIYCTQPNIGKTVKQVLLKVEERTKPQDFVSVNPDATTILSDVVNKVNQNIANNNKFKTDITKQQTDFETKINTDHNAFKEEVNGLVAGKLINDDVTTKDRTWSSEKISNHPFGNIQAEDTITFNNALDQIVQPKLYGKSTQTTTKGYQLFDASKLPTKTQGGATVTNNGDGSLTISGSGVLTESNVIQHIFRKEDYPNLLKAGSITLDVKGVTLPYAYANFHNENGLYKACVLNGISRLTVGLEQSYIDSNWYMSFGITSAVGQTIKPGTIKPMLYQDGDGTWEPFTGGKPSPSPEYPQEIVSKEVSEINVCGKNLFSVDMPFEYSNGTNNYKLILKPNTEYTLSTNSPTFTKVASLYFNGGSSLTNGVSINKPLTSRSNDKGELFIFVRIVVSEEGFNLYKGVKEGKYWIQLEEGAKATQYQPYKSQSITLSQPITLRGILTDKGNITINGQQYISDVICEKDGVIGVERNIDKVDLKNTPGINQEGLYDNEYSFLYSLETTLPKEKMQMLSRYFTYTTNKLQTSLIKEVNCFCQNDSYNSSGNWLYFRCDYDFFKVTKDSTSIEKGRAFRNWLDSLPVFDFYYNGKPTFEPLPQVDQDKFKTLLAHQGITNLFANAYIDLNYISSSKYVLPYPIYSEQEIDDKLKKIPTKTSELTNDSGYQTSSQVESTITSKGYQTSQQVQSAISGKADTSQLGTQVTYQLSGTTLIITTK